MKLGELIKKYRKDRKLTLRDFASLCGMSHSYISMLEEGRNSKTGEPITPTLSTLKKISKALGLTSNELMTIIDDMPVIINNDNNFDYSTIPELRPVKVLRFPMMRSIACDHPTFEEDKYEAYVDDNANINADFCMTAQGDSMINARVHDGDIVFIHSQNMMENGEIAAVLIENKISLKRVYYYPDQNKIILTAENAKFPPLVYTNEGLKQVKILGKAVSFMSNF